MRRPFRRRFQRTLYTHLLEEHEISDPAGDGIKLDLAAVDCELRSLNG